MVPSFEKYLQKHPSFTNFNPEVIKPSHMVVVIPVYLEDRLQDTIDSLLACTPVEGGVAVFLVVNAGIHSPADVVKYQQGIADKFKSWQCNQDWIQFYTIEAFDLPKKHFGAGMARKIGMDMAIQHFINTDNVNGIIISLDADTIVQPNYFEALQHFFAQKKHQACSIYFEHPLDGDEFEAEVYEAITLYELHLRYYVECLCMIGFPYAYHTIGSCFAVKAAAYVKVGGMNRRQGGEEFYFLQKIIQLGGFGEANNTIVHPSPRISDRVPFGTGPSVKAILEKVDSDYHTYNLQGFIDLKEFFENIDKYYQVSEDEYHKIILELPGRVRSFLLNSDFYAELDELSKNCSTLNVFKKRFYELFNAFKLVKYINYVHEHFLERIPVFDASIELLQQLGYDTDDFFEEKELLMKFRAIQKQL
jgi:hypothetical protein